MRCQSLDVVVAIVSDGFFLVCILSFLRQGNANKSEKDKLQHKGKKTTTIFRVALTWYCILHRTNSDSLTIYDKRNGGISALTRTPQTMSGFACAHDISHFIILLSFKMNMVSTWFSVVHWYEGMWLFGDTDLFKCIRDPVSRETIFDLLPAFQLQYLSIAMIHTLFLKKTLTFFVKYSMGTHFFYR